MNVEQRKEALTQVQQGAPKMTGITLMYHGERREFNAYQIPLSVLTYNPYNGRIGSVVKSYERQNHTLDMDNSDDVAIIEQFLWESKVDANERTRASLLKEHQKRYGIVTADGIIIDGNRRACLLNSLWRDESIDANRKQHTQFFTAIILPGDADKKEILRLETTYQMGEDAKVDYNPIEKYLKAKDLADAGFTNNDIASFMGESLGNIKMYLSVLKLIDEYLETYGYTGIYTVLDTREDSFQKLDHALRQYAAGGVAKMWGYDVESDVSDLKTIGFDYIRLGFDQMAFRDIIRKPNKNNNESSFFANEEVWRNFSTAHFDAVQDISEKTVEDIISENPTGDIKRLFRFRDESWRRKVQEKLILNYYTAKDKITNKQQAAEPMKLLRKAWEALYAIDTEQDAFKNDTDVKKLLEKIKGIVQEYEDLFRE